MVQMASSCSLGEEVDDIENDIEEDVDLSIDCSNDRRSRFQRGVAQKKLDVPSSPELVESDDVEDYKSQGDDERGKLQERDVEGIVMNENVPIVSPPNSSPNIAPMPTPNTKVNDSIVETVVENADNQLMPVDFKCNIPEVSDDSDSVNDEFEVNRGTTEVVYTPKKPLLLKAKGKPATARYRIVSAGSCNTSYEEELIMEDEDDDVIVDEHINDDVDGLGSGLHNDGFHAATTFKFVDEEEDDVPKISFEKSSAETTTISTVSLGSDFVTIPTTGCNSSASSFDMENYHFSTSIGSDLRNKLVLNKRSLKSLRSSSSSDTGSAVINEKQKGKCDVIVEETTTPSSKTGRRRRLSPLFLHIENNNWVAVEQRVKEAPREAEEWVTIRRRSKCNEEKKKVKRLALHHACLKLRKNTSQQMSSAIMALISAYPAAASKRETHHGCLPLHFFAFSCDRSSMEVLDALLQAHPKAIRSDSEGGRMPLHMACVSGTCPYPIFCRLLEKYPDAARHRTQDQSLPLHLLAEHGVFDPAIVQELLKKYPDAAHGLNKHGRIPLEEAIYAAGYCGRPHQLSLVTDLRKNPSFWMGRGNTVPEKISVQKSISLVELDNVLSQMVTTTPNHHHQHNLSDFSDLNNTAESLAIDAQNLSAKEAETLANKHDLADLILRCQWDCIPLRARIKPNEIREWLTVTGRTGVTTHMSPLHYACERDPPRSTVEALFCPEGGVSVPGSQHPLHMACTWGASVEVVAFLVENDHEGVRARDDLGNLPLHWACYSSTPSEDIVAVLLHNYPEAVWVTNDAGRTPLDVCRRLKNSRTVQSLLVQTRSALGGISTHLSVGNSHVNGHSVPNDTFSTIDSLEPTTQQSRSNTNQHHQMLWV